MKKVLFTSIAVALFTACSNDDLVMDNNDANEIKFAVTTERASRAADVYCTNNLPGTFNVSAAYNEKIYIDNDQIALENGKWVNKSGLRYWPNGGDVKFYGYANSKITWTGATALPTFTDFQVDDSVAKQVDLLYAVQTQAKGETANPVNLNFRHALSQIVFNARNENKNLYVEIAGVSLCNVMSKGTYTFPDVANTDEHLSCPPDATESNPTSRGSWDEANLSELASYEVTFDETIPLPGIQNTKENIDLTTAPSTDKEFNTGAMLLIPQTTEAVTAGKGNTSVTSKAKDSYFLVKCKICNVANGSGTANTNDVILWPKQEEGKEPVEYANILIPVAFNWAEGYKYTYTFVFGKGNGGYDPENPGDDPVLVPITFTVDVDEFIPVVPSTDIESKLPETGE